ncbi:MAG: hypothetical protein AAFQ19_16900 [Pseudomonadota bacterium]
MQLTRSNALLRALSACAKLFHLPRRRPARPGPSLPPLSPHIARDIGLSPSDEARLRHRWPSQSTQHPYL